MVRRLQSGGGEDGGLGAVGGEELGHAHHGSQVPG